MYDQCYSLARSAKPSGQQSIMSVNWLGLCQRPQIKDSTVFFDQITTDAVKALSPHATVNLKAKQIILFTQEQVDTVLQLADYRITVQHIDFYYVLKREKAK